MWSGLSLGVTPAMTALLAPFWGRLSDRFGRKIMVERSLVSFIFLMAGMAYVTQAVARLRAARGPGAVRRLRRHRADDGRGVGAAGAHGLRDRHRADRAAARPGARARHRRRRRADGRAARAFLVTSGFYVVALADRVLHVRRTARPPRRPVAASSGRVALQERARVRELRPADGGDLRPAVRRPQLRADPAAVRRASSARRSTGCRWSPGSSSRSPRPPARSAISCARGCCDRRPPRSIIAGAAAHRRRRRAALRSSRRAPRWLFAATPVLGRRARAWRRPRPTPPRAA